MRPSGEEALCKVLPKEVREALMRAAYSPGNIETRARLIDAIVARARIAHPSFFKGE